MNKTRLKNARLRSILGFSRNVVELALNHERSMANIGLKVIKALPITEAHLDKVLELSAKAQEHAQAVQTATNSFTTKVLESDTVKECASRIAIAATDRIVRSLNEAPLPHDKAVEEAFAEGCAQGYEDARGG